MENLPFHINKLSTTILILLMVVISYLENIEVNKKIVYSNENKEMCASKLLIVAEQSKYKDAIVTGIKRHFENKQVFVKIIELSELKNIALTEWDALCLIYSWQKERPVKPIRRFFSKSPNKEKLVILTTSSEGKKKMEDVDGISGASILIEVPVKTRILIGQLEKVLKRKIT